MSAGLADARLCDVPEVFVWERQGPCLFAFVVVCCVNAVLHIVLVVVAVGGGGGGGVVVIAVVAVVCDVASIATFYLGSWCWLLIYVIVAVFGVTASMVIYLCSDVVPDCFDTSTLKVSHV